MTLKEALDTIATHCKRTRCEDCPFGIEAQSDENMRYSFCKLVIECPQDYDKIPIVEANMYNKITVVKNATVEIWENTKTGETSVGWYENEVKE